VIDIAGDPELERAIRFGLFHLIGSAADRGEAAVGARGLTGPAYRGHVFWDADVFVLPFLAATHPRAARAMLEYRLRRLPVACAEARREGSAGAHFPWESAATGVEAAPTRGRDRLGRFTGIRTGQLEEHIVSDIAWAACCYADWTCDEAFLRGPGRDLVLETARWWAERIELDATGQAHIRGVIGPDEYHEPVDDNAFTNVMARWNLRRAAALAGTCPEAGVGEGERSRWRALADALVDGYDPSTGIYEQFAGFHRLEPLLIADVAPRRPIAATLLLGDRRIAGAQVIKQADVLMLHHLLPDDVAPGSLEPNLDYYEPRTAHGSSLSPGVHASLLARAGRLDDACELLRVTCGIDLDDITQTTAGGVHLAAMGSAWQAVAFGFGGLRPCGDTLVVSPRVPPAWRSLTVRVRFRGTRMRIIATPGSVTIHADRPGRVQVANGEPVVVKRGETTLSLTEGSST
jgi:trehalose/maltose hydrolase-like predicted phosphorylase